MHRNPDTLLTENRSRLTRNRYWSQSTSSCNGTMVTGGKLSGGVNMEGINYYNNLIDKLISEGKSWFLVLLCVCILMSNQQCRYWTICYPFSLGLPASIRTAVRWLLKPAYCVSKTWPTSSWICVHGSKLITVINNKKQDDIVRKRKEKLNLFKQHYQGRFQGLCQHLLQGVWWQGKVLDNIQRALEFQYWWLF